MSTSGKLIINAALNGMIPTKADNPNVPISPEEIAADARRCMDAGASILHIHARAADGTPTYRKETYQEILRLVRNACPQAILCVSTSGRVHTEFAQRGEVLELSDPKPEMASLTLGSLNFPNQASINTPEMIQALAEKMRHHGILPELEIFEVGMAEYIGYLRKKNILTRPYYCNILLGNRGTMSATEDNLRTVVKALPIGTTWAATGIGRFQFDVNVMAIRLGGHVRVGLEDNLWFDPDRKIHATNASLIERLTQAARFYGRSLATPDEARAIIAPAES